MPVGAAFTSNLLAAAPVQVSRAHLAESSGLTAGIILNSGCANAATGAEGRLAAERICDLGRARLVWHPSIPRLLDGDDRHAGFPWSGSRRPCRG